MNPSIRRSYTKATIVLGTAQYKLWPKIGKYNCISGQSNKKLWGLKEASLLFLYLREREPAKGRRRKSLKQTLHWAEQGAPTHNASINNLITIPQSWDHDLSWNQELDAQLTEPPRCPCLRFSYWLNILTSFQRSIYLLRLLPNSNTFLGPCDWYIFLEIFIKKTSYLYNSVIMLNLSVGEH